MELNITHRLISNDAERRVFDYLVQYKAKHDGVAPTLREICIGCRINSTSLVNFYLDKLEEMGLITRIGTGVSTRASRGIMVTGGKWRLQGG